MASSKYTILFHGNCIDGWFSSFIAYTALKNTNTIKMFPISPSATHTWPTYPEIAGSHVLLLDVSVAKEHRDTWMAAGALSIACIDHHASALEHSWPIGTINTAACAALQTWYAFYPGMPIPPWLMIVDRIDRWDNPTYEDRCVREVLNVIAHKPVQKKLDEAIKMSEELLTTINDPGAIAALVMKGVTILDKKDAELLSILNKGVFMFIGADNIALWDLPRSWLGMTIYIIDNSGITLDTTEAAHLVFTKYPVCSVFINYRKKTVAGGKTLFTYSARSHGVNLTDGTILRGHPTAAGATFIKKVGEMAPFELR